MIPSFLSDSSSFLRSLQASVRLFLPGGSVSYAEIASGWLFATDLVLLAQLNFGRVAEQANVGIMSLGEVSCVED